LTWTNVTPQTAVTATSATRAGTGRGRYKRAP
jgi:hypothetical protein